MQEKSLIFKFGATLLGVGALISTSGCAAFNRQFGTSLPEGAFDTPASGAVVGAGVGAGAGAIIGSVTGALAPGIIVGAAAGGMAGAAIGEHNQKEALAVAQAEHFQQTNERQEIILDQNNEIKKRREDLEDQRGSLANPNTAKGNVSSASLAYNRPSVAPAGYSPDTYRGSPRANAYSANQATVSRGYNSSAYASSASGARGASAYRKSANTQLASAKSPAHSNQLPNAKSSVSTAEMTKETPPNHPLLANLPSEERHSAEALGATPSSTEPAKDVTGSLPPAKGITPQEPKFAAQDAVSMNPAAGTSAVGSSTGQTDIKATEVPISAVAAAGEKSPANKVNSLSDSSSNVASSADCNEAQGEADRALAAASAADKLFYYRRALKLCPQNAGYHLETGKIYVEIERAEDAAFEFRQALDLQPGNTEAKSALSLLEKNEVKVDEGPIVQ